MQGVIGEMMGRLAISVFVSGTLVLGLAVGWFARPILAPSRTPDAIREACRIVMPALEEADHLARQATDAIGERSLAHPVRANEVWRARHQAALEEAAQVALGNADQMPGDWPWWSHVFALDRAQSVLGGALPGSSVEQQSALEAVSLACLGRA